MQNRDIIQQTIFDPEKGMSIVCKNCNTGGVAPKNALCMKAICPKCGHGSTITVEGPSYAIQGIQYVKGWQFIDNLNAKKWRERNQRQLENWDAPPKNAIIKRGSKSDNAQIPEKDLPDSLLANYDIIKVIGKGAFGKVYLAIDNSDDKKVAIKILEKTHLNDPVLCERFENDGLILMTLRHRNLVHVYNVLEQRILIMEHIDGGSLRDKLISRGKMNPSIVFQIAIDVFSALQLAHSHGIIHRDIKPENILLTNSGEPKLCDFGIAHFPEASIETSHTTHHIFHPGTIAYMSPEQIRGEKLDARSDIYSMGVVIHELLSGKHYISKGDRKSPLAIASAVLNIEPTSVGSLLNRTLNRADKVLKKMMSKDRNRRHNSSIEAIKALNELLCKI